MLRGALVCYYLLSHQSHAVRPQRLVKPEQEATAGCMLKLFSQSS